MLNKLGAETWVLILNNGDTCQLSGFQGDCRILGGLLVCSHVLYLMHADFPKERTNYIFRVTVWIAWILKWLGNLEEFCSVIAMAQRRRGLVPSL